MTDQDTHIKALECLLFAAKEPVPMARLAEVLEVEATELPGLLTSLEHSFEGRGLHVVKLAGGYSLATRPEYADHVRRLLEPDPERLSVQALETLAIIAYRQPITRPEIEDVRGVHSSASVTSLLQKGLVRIAGRRDAAGRPFLFETTPQFLSAFGLSELDELPDLGELRRRLYAQGVLETEEPGPDPEAPVALADEVPEESLAEDVPDEGRGPESGAAETGPSSTEQ